MGADMTSIIAAMQAAINSYWSSKGFPGSPPMIADNTGMLTAMLGTYLAPLPQAGAGVGQSLWIYGASGAILYAPAGGMWEILSVYYSNASNNVLSLYTALLPASDVVSGGAQVLAAYSGYYPIANVWRIA